MKKKFKLFTSMISFCFSLAVLCFGVYAATTANFSMSGMISYEITNVYVEVTTNFYTTSKKFDLASEFKENAEMLEQKTLDQLSDSVFTNSGAVLTRLTDKVSEYSSLTATQAHEYLDHDITFSEAEDGIFAHYVVINVKNLSEKPAYVKITDKHPIYITDSGVITYRTNDITEIEEGESVNMVVGYALFNSEKTIDGIEYENSVEIGLSEEYNPLKADPINEYYYVEMGDYYGNPIRWRMVGINQVADTTTGNTDLVHYSSFDANTLPTGVTGVFIQETNTGYYYQYYYNCETEDCIEYEGSKYTERDERWLGLSSVNFNRYKQVGTSYPYNYYAVDDDGEYITDENGDEVNANNYFYSLARDYINGIDVYKRDEWDNNNEIYIPYTDEDKSSMLTDFDISSDDYIYSRIQARNLSDMTAYSGAFNDDQVWTPTSTNYAEGQTGSDKMWLLSIEEALVLLGGVSSTTAWDWSNVELMNKLVWGYNNNEYDEEGNCVLDDYAGSYFWLRSPSSDLARCTYFVYDGGDWDYNDVNSYYNAARAAFQLAI